MRPRANNPELEGVGAFGNIRSLVWEGKDGLSGLIFFPLFPVFWPLVTIDPPGLTADFRPKPLSRQNFSQNLLAAYKNYL